MASSKGARSMWGQNRSFLTEMLASVQIGFPEWPHECSFWLFPTTRCLTKALAMKYEESGIQDEGTVYKMPSCSQMWSLVTVLENYS